MTDKIYFGGGNTLRSFKKSSIAAKRTRPTGAVYLSIIIPTYNQEEIIPKTLKSIDEYLRGQNYKYEIIVVNDGSEDKTGRAVRAQIPLIKNLKLIDYKENRGKGYAVKTGMMVAKGEYRVFTDDDNSAPVNQVEKMLVEFKAGYDVVIGSRDLKGAILDPAPPFYRRFIGQGFKILRKIFCDVWELEDTQCGFKGFTERAARDIFPRCRIERFAFDPEVVLIAKKLGYKIKEIPIYWKNDPHSRVKSATIAEMGKDILRIRLNSIKGLYDKKI